MKDLRALLILNLSFVAVVLGLLLFAVKSNIDMSTRLVVIEEQIATTKQGDAVRDTWMREHRGELMKRIESRQANR